MTYLAEHIKGFGGFIEQVFSFFDSWLVRFFCYVCRVVKWEGARSKFWK